MSAADTKPLPGSVTLAAGPETPTGPEPKKTRRPRRVGAYLPYLLIAPAIALIAGVLGWPLIETFILSFQDMRRNNLWSGTAPEWVGFEQFSNILADPEFWEVTWRTIIFMAVCVTVTMVGGLLIALLLQRVSTWVRLTMTVALVAVWSMPVLVATGIFRWLFDSDYGLINQLLSELPGVNMQNHNWFIDPNQGLAVIAAVVIWGALPFIAVSLHSALTQVPQELEEAARIDGAKGFGIFRYVTMPVIKPVLVMTGTLSVIWDFNVFAQVFLMRQSAPEEEYRLLGIYSFQKAFESNSYSQGAAIALITVLMLAGVAVYYLRQLIKIGEVE